MAGFRQAQAHEGPNRHVLVSPLPDPPMRPRQCGLACWTKSQSIACRAVTTLRTFNSSHKPKESNMSTLKTFISACCVSFVVMPASNARTQQTDALIAIDVLIEPDAAMIDKAKAANAR